jgi:hypothetical protein
MRLTANANRYVLHPFSSGQTNEKIIDPAKPA